MKHITNTRIQIVIPLYVQDDH